MYNVLEKLRRGEPLTAKGKADPARALRAVLLSTNTPHTATELAKHFRRANAERVEELLETLISLGQARKIDGGRYSA